MWHYPRPFQKNYRKSYPESKLYIPGFISQYNLISDKEGMPFFLSIARIKLALVRPDEYNDLVLPVTSMGRPFL